MHPDRVFRKGGARAGRRARCCRSRSAPASRSPPARPADKAIAIAGMRRLNRTASETLQSFGDAVHAVTDVTGYGLAGHGWEMAERSGVRVVVDTSGIVAYPAAAAAAAGGVRTGGDPRNRDYLAGHLDSTAGRRPGGAVLRPADVGRAAGRRRSRPRGGAGRCGGAGHGGGSARSRAARRGWCCGSVAGDDGPRTPTDSEGSSGSCGTRATTSSSASTRSAAARGPGR